MKSATKCYQAKTGEIERDWVVVDATDKILGRLATEIALLLRGKRKPQFTPHVDTGDFVIVVNASKVKLTGKKATDKMYYTHTAWQGSLKETSAGKMLEKHPDRVIRFAVNGMLPKNRLSRQIINKLKIYPGAEHPHGAQKPRAVEI